MAQAQNTFLKSKMNQDLDARLMPSGEYRTAFNVQVSRSEGDDVGSLENALGTSLIKNFSSMLQVGDLDCIGTLADEVNGLMYLFLTDNTNTLRNQFPQEFGSGAYVPKGAAKGETLRTPGVNYDKGVIYPCTGGTGTGLTFYVSGVTTPPPSSQGPISTGFIQNPGSGYTTGDVLTVDGGSGASAGSGGEITITELAGNNFIFQVNISTNTATCLVQGSFLNFSTQSPIYGVNILEGLLFFTDNRNQPRVIDVNLANPEGLSVPTYYTNEDQISVAKYNPYQPIELYDFSIIGSSSATPYESTLKDVTSKAFPNGGTGDRVGPYNGDGSAPNALKTIRLTPFSVSGDIVVPSSLYPSGASVGYISNPSGGPIIPITGATVSSAVYDTTTDVANPAWVVTIIGGDFPIFPANATYEFIFNYNTYYNSKFSGDDNFLKDKFARFGYRFKFENNEYSIFSPFTQTAFTPKQDGYFMYLSKQGLSEIDDQTNTYRSTVVSFVENKVNEIKLKIPLPYKNFNLADTLKLTEIDILYKESDSVAVKVVDTLDANFIFNAAATFTTNQVVTNTAGPFSINNISGGIKVGDTVTGVGLGSASLTTYPAKVVTFVPTDPSNPIAGLITLDQSVTLETGITFNVNDPNYLDYTYQSTKPFKTLPEFQTTRVYDKVPVKALAQEIAGNRVIYGNYQDKHTPPSGINYNVNCSPKYYFSLNELTAVTTASYSNVNTVIIDFAGKDMDLVADGMIFTSESIGAIIPDDTFISSFTINGNSVTVVLTNNVTLPSSSIIILEPGGNVENYTSRIEYPSHSVKTNRNYQVGFVLSDKYGRQSSVVLSNNTEELIAPDGTAYSGSTIYSPYISEGFDQDSWPGNSLKVLVNDPIQTNPYNNDISSYSYNPLGWYSYKIVVKQTEQEYYNVYLPGIMASYPDVPTKEINNTSHIVLINDNINKIPRDLSEVGPTQKQFRSSVQLFGRVENTAPSTKINPPNVGDANIQYYPGRFTDTVSTISTVNDLFDYNPVEPLQPNYFPQFYDINSNPLIGRISTQSKIGQVSTTYYSPASAVVAATVDNNYEISLSSVTGTPTVDSLVSGKNIPDNVYVDSFVASIGVNSFGITQQSGGGSGTTVDINYNSIPAPAFTSAEIIGSIVTGNQITELTKVTGWSYTAGAATGTLTTDVDISAVQNSERLTFTPTPGVLKLKNNSDPKEVFRVSLAADTVLSFTKTDGPFTFIKDTPGIQYLAVYETEPVVSLLDIFWETSSAGLLSDLNDAILNGSSAGANFDFFNLNPFTEALPQGTQANPTYILNSSIQLTTNFGDVISGGNLVLDSVTEFLPGSNETGIDVQLESNPVPGPYFQLLDLGSSNVGPWQIITTDAYYNNVFYFYNADALRRNFKFSFTATVNGQESTIVKLASVGNIEPIIKYPPNQTVLPPIFTNRTFSTGLIRNTAGILTPLTGVNGANNANLAYQNQGPMAGLEWSIDYIRKGTNNAANNMSIENSSFSLEQVINSSTKQLECQIVNNDPLLDPDVYFINVTLADGGASVSTLVTLNFGIFIPSSNVFNSRVEGRVNGDSTSEPLAHWKGVVIKIDSAVSGAATTSYGYYFYLGGYFKHYDGLQGGGNNDNLTEYSGGNFITIPNTVADGNGQTTWNFPQPGGLVYYEGTRPNCPVWWYAQTLGDLFDLLKGVAQAPYPTLWMPCFDDLGSTGSLYLSPTSGDSEVGVPQNPDTTGYSFQII